MKKSMQHFDLTGRVAVITGGAGLLGRQHAHALAQAGAYTVLLDIDGGKASEVAAEIQAEHGVASMAQMCDITLEITIESVLKNVLQAFGRLDILVNNAANDVKIERGDHLADSRLEHMPLEQWQADLDVGVTGAMLCSRVFGKHLADHGGGVILNIGSILALTAPDQRIYRLDDLEDDRQPVKTVTYSVVKHALIGLTRYLATYWAHKGVRANALCPGGVYNENLPEEFVKRLTNLIPLGRMARLDEYRGAVQFLCSDASAYMNGAVVTMDGGQTVW
ncbi:MAG: SDR family oxidoreductase [Acidobacteriota bacterium]|nr:SDR family oxidoreductase [Acidobacteriota bacterium]